EVVHLGAARVVGIDVPAHVDAARPRVVDQPQHAVDLPPVLAPADLDVGDLHADLGLLADADGLADGVLDHRALATHVGEVEALTPGDPAGQGHQLRGLGVRARRIDQPGGVAVGSGIHGLVEPPLHGAEVARVHRAIVGPHGGEAEGAVADEVHDVDRGPDRAQRIEILPEGLPAQVDAGPD